MKTFFRNRSRNPAVTALKVAIWLAFAAVVVWLVMLLWNWLMPALFTGARTIGYWQALGLIVLSRVLFGHGGGRRHWRAHRRWHNMRQEEREKFQQYAKSGRCGRPAEPDYAGEQAK